jgi:hypothetical protein
LKTKNKLGVLDYLEGRRFNFECVDLANHENCDKVAGSPNWRDTSRALWVFAHVRRAYPGIPMGVAFGEKPIDGKSVVVNILWYKERDDKEGALKSLYWDPSPTANRQVKFKPIALFV